MSFDTNPNETAHPYLKCTSLDDKINDVWFEGGLTKRELFAAMALQGLLQNCPISVDEAESFIKYRTVDAMRAADALIITLNQNPVGKSKS